MEYRFQNCLMYMNYSEKAEKVLAARTLPWIGSEVSEMRIATFTKESHHPECFGSKAGTITDTSTAYGITRVANQLYDACV